MDDGDEIEFEVPAQFTPRRSGYRLTYGTLFGRDATSSPEAAYPALYFPVDLPPDQEFDFLSGLGELENAGLGRLTFENLDAVRICDAGPDVGAASWVRVVPDSSWARQRRDQVSPLAVRRLEHLQHYVFRLPGTVVEAVAEGIWLDLADKQAPYGRVENHPLADLPLEAGSFYTSHAGTEWRLRISPRGIDDLVRGARLCSQLVYQFDAPIRGHLFTAADLWWRERDGRLESQLVRQELGGPVVLSRRDGKAHPADFSDEWETELARLAELDRGRTDL